MWGITECGANYIQLNCTQPASASRPTINFQSAAIFSTSCRSPTPGQGDIGHANRQDECPQGQDSRPNEGAHRNRHPCFSRYATQPLIPRRRNARSSQQSITPTASASATRSSAKGYADPRLRRTILAGESPLINSTPHSAPTSRRGTTRSRTGWSTLRSTFLGQGKRVSVVCEYLGMLTFVFSSSFRKHARGKKAPKKKSEAPVLGMWPSPTFLWNFSSLTSVGGNSGREEEEVRGVAPSNLYNSDPWHDKQLNICMHSYISGLERQTQHLP